jgi:hypothetical protein
MMKGEEKRLMETEVWGDEDHVLQGGAKGYEAQLERGWSIHTSGMVAQCQRYWTRHYWLG